MSAYLPCHKSSTPVRQARRLWPMALVLLLLLGTLYALPAFSGPAPEIKPQWAGAYTPYYWDGCYDARDWNRITSASGQVGDMVTVYLESNGEHGIGAQITFDPTLLQVVDAAGNPTASVELSPHAIDVYANAVDNTNGTILVDFYCNCLATGTHRATLRFRTLAEGYARLHFADGAYYTMAGPVEFRCFTSLDGMIVIGDPPTPTSTATTTATATATSTATPAAHTVLVHGVVRSAAGAPVAGAQIALLRHANGWLIHASGASNAEGVFRLWSSPIVADYRLQILPPAGYTAVSAALPTGLSGEIVAPDTLQFALDGGTTEVGPFQYVLQELPTPGPSATPQPTLPAAVVQGHVWLDGYGAGIADGIRQPEEGLAGCELRLDDGALDAIRLAISDAQGHYVFAVPPGPYTLTLYDPEGRLPNGQRTVVAGGPKDSPADWTWAQRWLPLVGKQ